LPFTHSIKIRNPQHLCVVKTIIQFLIPQQ
jgi:hypothetical protein